MGWRRILATATAVAAGTTVLVSCASERAAQEPPPVVGSLTVPSPPTSEPGPPPTALTTDTTMPVTTTTTAPITTTTTAPPTTPPPSTEPEVLGPGAVGLRTWALQQRLTDLRYDPGPIDGEFGSKTTMAVWAYQALHGYEPDGLVTPALLAEIQAPGATGVPAPLRPDGGGERTEIDIARQVLVLYEGGVPRLITHISTGTGKRYCENGHCGTARTPPGDFAYTWRYNGWRTSYLGELYNPVYFNGGIAVHGSRSVPNYPASHGCVRIPMHIAEYFPDLVDQGDPVYVV